jgi:hypothetical protein
MKRYSFLQRFFNQGFQQCGLGMVVIQNKLTTIAFTAVILFAIVSMTILFYICAVATWTINIHKQKRFNNLGHYACPFPF